MMRKTTMATTLGLALCFGAVAVASAQSTEQAPPQARRGQAGQWGEGGGHRGMGMLLKGITLSADQKTRVDALLASNRSKETREQFRKEMTDARAARERGDTATARAKMQALRSQMEKNREQEIASIRSVLTADQQRQFDANVAEWKQHAGEHRGHKGREAGNN
jgi:Spy/CpxP family protein refolding chaperone